MSILHVIFRVAESEYMVPAEQVVQMESYAGATVVPGAPAHVAGIVQIRGQVIPVIDLRARFGLPPVERTLDSRVVVVERGKRAVGLLVDSAREVARLEADQLKETPAALSEASRGWVTAVAQIGPRLLMRIDIDRVIGGESHGG